MTPNQRHIVECLIIVAWADGRVAPGELGVIEGMLCGFDASEDEERELLDFAHVPRSFGDLELDALATPDRELLMENAALLMRADGDSAATEVQVLERLSALLGVPIPAAS